MLPGLTVITRSYDGFSVIFSRVPAEICAGCGESLFQTGVVERMNVLHSYNPESREIVYTTKQFRVLSSTIDLYEYNTCGSGNSH